MKLYIFYLLKKNRCIFSEKFGMLNVLCDTTYLAKMFCFGLKFIDYFCELIDFLSDAALHKIEKSIFI